MNKYNIFVKILLDRISKPPVGIDGSAFSKNIVRKYGVFINSGRLPSLIFLRLFGGRRVNNIITNNINNTILHEYITNKYYETGDYRSFPISTTTVRAPGITLHSINSIATNYLQRFINIRNTDSKFNKKRSIVDENISQDTVNISNKIINYFHGINNIGSRVIHPLVYGLHPSFNEKELINKKIFPIQDVDLTYASEPVLNIPTSQNADIVQEKIENIPAGSINSIGINESLRKESPSHRPVHEIHMIADKVYKIIEKKISVEKDRRGLF